MIKGIALKESSANAVIRLVTTSTDDTLGNIHQQVKINFAARIERRIVLNGGLKVTEITLAHSFLQQQTPAALTDGIEAGDIPSPGIVALEASGMIEQALFHQSRQQINGRFQGARAEGVDEKDFRVRIPSGHHLPGTGPRIEHKWILIAKSNCEEAFSSLSFTL